MNYESPRSNENDAVRSKKERVAPDPLLFSDSEAAKEIAEKLISKHHHELASAKFIYLCRNKSAKSGGKPVPGHIKKLAPMDKHLSRSYCEAGEEPDFVMVVALDVWNDLQPNQRVALIDHLLTRCQAVEDEKSGEMKFSIRPPQVQEFPEVVERHGRWNEDLIEMGNCLEDK